MIDKCPPVAQALSFLALIALGACTQPHSAAPSQGKKMGLQVGDSAPDFALTNHEGKKSKLADFRGKRLLIWFYPKASTGG
jgi:cytochrome oxidase Cu insertion factor (SCO1/SenC/PrrC family)